MSFTLHDRVLVCRIEPEAKNAGGLSIPDSARAKPKEERAGSGGLISMSVEPGDRILGGMA